MKKFTVDIRKGLEVVTDSVQKAADLGKAVAVGVQSGAKEFSDQTKRENYERLLKKYNPVFPEQYNSKAFNIPNMVVIVDDAVRKGIEVCEGAIGWLRTENGVEVLCLYDEAVAFSGLKFVPAATCDSVYYVDNFDRRQFIRLDCLFSRAHKEKIAELQHVAYCLGAKRCSIEIKESDIQKQEQKKKLISGNRMAIKGMQTKVDTKVEEQKLSQSVIERKGSAVIDFEGTQEISSPELKWFMYDDNIKRLIEMRCRGENAVKIMTLELEGSASATMSQKTALAIDAAAGKIGANHQLCMESQAMKESFSKLVFHIEF